MSPKVLPALCTTHPLPLRRNSGQRILQWVLVSVEVLISAGAMYGGVGLIDHDRVGISADWLTATPFTNWVWPGIFLLLIVAVPMLLAAMAETFRLRWAYWLTILAGAAQVGWIVVQWFIMGRFFVLQPVMLAAGAVVMLLGWLVHRGGRPDGR